MQNALEQKEILSNYYKSEIKQKGLELELCEAKLKESDLKTQIFVDEIKKLAKENSQLNQNTLDSQKIFKSYESVFNTTKKTIQKLES